MVPYAENGQWNMYRTVYKVNKLSNANYFAIMSCIDSNGNYSLYTVQMKNSFNIAPDFWSWENPRVLLAVSLAQRVIRSLLSLAQWLPLTCRNSLTTLIMLLLRDSWSSSTETALSILPSRSSLSTRLSPLQTSDKALTESSLFSASLTQHGQLSRISSLPLPPLRSSRRLPILASPSSSLLASFRCTRVCLRISLKVSREPS